MNETTGSTSTRYDSADGTGAAGDERHAIQTYLSDALALERHIAQPLDRQSDLDDSAQFSAALAVIAHIKAVTAQHISGLENQLSAAGGHAASPVKSAWSQLLGAGAAAVDSARKTKVSKNLRDDYTALALATASYTMLHATALGLGDATTAELAQGYLADYARCVVEIASALPGVVLEELRLDGERVQTSVAETARENVKAAWRSHEAAL